MPDLNSIELALSSLGWNKARIKCLAAALVAILTVQSINLKKIANLFPTDADPKSAYKRLQRFLRFFDPDLDSLAILLARLCTPSRQSMSALEKMFLRYEGGKGSSPSTVINIGSK